MVPLSGQANLVPDEPLSALYIPGRPWSRSCWGASLRADVIAARSLTRPGRPQPDAGGAPRPSTLTRRVCHRARNPALNYQVSGNRYQ